MGDTVLEATTLDGMGSMRVVTTEAGAAVERLDTIGARYLTLSRHADVEAALARCVATLEVAGAVVVDIGSGRLGPRAAVAVLSGVLDPCGVHVDGVRWERLAVEGERRWLPCWPAPDLWDELQRDEQEWRTPRGGLSWQREVVARFDDVYVHVAVGDVREAFVVVGRFADTAAGLAAARAVALPHPGERPAC